MTFRKIKDPDAVLDYSVDWSAWLVDDTITTSGWTIAGPDASLVVDSDSKSATAATVWLSGGAEQRKYSVTNRITTAMGRTEDRTVLIVVYSR